MADLSKVKASWDALGRLDPLFAILTERGKHGGRWAEPEFFSTGIEEIGLVRNQLERLELVPARGRALDFGCGVGRLAQALADHFESVVGVDIAPSMVSLAETYNRHGGRCTYQALDSGDLSAFESHSFDFIYSVLVLQHMPISNAERYIAEFFRVLKPGGVLVFQMPDQGGEVSALRERLRTLLPRSILNLYRAWRHGPAVIETETNTLERPQVEALIAARGGNLVHVDGDHGRRLRYWVRN